MVDRLPSSVHPARYSLVWVKTRVISATLKGVPEESLKVTCTILNSWVHIIFSQSAFLLVVEQPERYTATIEKI